MKDDEKDYSNDPKNESNKDHGFMKGDDLRKAAMEWLINNDNKIPNFSKMENGLTGVENYK